MSTAHGVCVIHTPGVDSTADTRARPSWRDACARTTLIKTEISANAKRGNAAVVRGRPRSGEAGRLTINQAGVISPRGARPQINTPTDTRIGWEIYAIFLQLRTLVGLPCARVRSAVRCSHSCSLQTLWTLLPLDVASCGDTAHRITGCPLCHLHFPLPPTSRPPFFHRAAPHTTAPRGRAPSVTRMWSAGRPDGELGVHCHIRALSHSCTVKALGHNMFPPSFCPWNWLSCRSP